MFFNSDGQHCIAVAALRHDRPERVSCLRQKVAAVLRNSSKAHDFIRESVNAGMFTEDLYDIFRGDFKDTWADAKFGIAALLRDHSEIANVLDRISALIAIGAPRGIHAS